MSPALSQIRALCFDLDDTFWDVRQVLDRAEQRVGAFLERRYPRLALRHGRADFLAARLQLAAAAPDRAHDLTWLRTETMRRLAVAEGYPDEAGAEAFEVFIAARNEVELFEDVRPALVALGARFRLGTFSNGNADLRRIGLHEHFVSVLNAESVGHAKPRPEAFFAAAAALGVAPPEMLYVGDNPRLDVVGAREAGCRAAWVNRNAQPWPEGLQPGADIEVTDLLALASRLGV